MAESSDGLVAPSQEVAPRASRWPLIERTGFRFLFCYFVLYAVPFPLGSLPWTQKLAELYGALLDPIVLWVGPNILGIDYSFANENPGSGDRTYDYVLMFCLLALATTATAIWSLIDRRPRRHDRLLEGLRLYIRVYLATTMLSYGFAKIFVGQFQPPSPYLLDRTYGDSSPMGLLWTFMGSSRPYTVFAGLMEALPGALLFFRRTTTIGALLLLAVMGNVVLLNFCYDVPVKLFSSHLWLMCLFLAAPAIPRLVALLVLNRPAPPAPSTARFTSRRARVACIGLYAILCGALAYEAIVPQLKRHIDMTRERPETVIVRDHFTVEEMTVDGRPLALADPVRWSGAWILGRSIRFDWADGRSEIYVAKADIEGSTRLDLRLATDGEDARHAHLEMRREGDSITLTGDFDGKQVTARLVSAAPPGSLLMSRGFHWINESPFFR